MITKEEYLKLIQEAYASENDEDLDDYVKCDAWIPAEPIHKKPLPNLSGYSDATNMKKDAIIRMVKTTKHISVGKFVIMVKFETVNLDGYNLYNLTLYETKNRTPSGAPCNMQFKVNVVKDSRFSGRPWLKFFPGVISGDYGRNIPEIVLVDIIRWLQAITKLPAFL